MKQINKMKKMKIKNYLIKNNYYLIKKEKIYDDKAK
jgi:hypothetical protein